MIDDENIDMWLENIRLREMFEAKCQTKTEQQSKNE